MMGGGGGGGSGGGNSGGDAERWLAHSEKLLLSGDLHGSKTYAIRACETDHSLVDSAELILAVADTLISGESRIRGTNSDLPDWYAVLRLVRLTHNPELVATQYSRLAVLLNPSRNRFPYSDQAFRLISDAWYVLSDPSRKAMYDRELQLSQFGQLGQLGFQLFNNQPPPPSQQQSPPQQQQQQQQVESPQHQTFQNQQLPFQLHQQQQQHPHFAQQRSQFDQHLMQSQSLQEQQQASWRQQFGQEQSESIRSGGSNTSGRDWKLHVEEERLINLNNATDRVQSSRRSYEASSHRTPSADLTWPSKATAASETVPWQSSEPVKQFQSSNRSTEAAQLSLLPLVSEPPPHVLHPARPNQSHSVAKPQSSFIKPFPMNAHPFPASKPFPVSQPSPTTNSFPVSQPSSNTKPFPVSQSSQKSNPLPVSQPAQNSNPFPVSQPTQNSNPFPVSQSSPKPKAFPVSQPTQNSNNLFPVSQPSSNSRPFPVSQSTQSSNPFPVSQPSQKSKPFPMSQPTPTPNFEPFSVSQRPSSAAQPFSQPPPASKPFNVSQPTTTSESLPVSQPQPPLSVQATHPSQPPEASSCSSTLPPVFSSRQPFQQPLVSTTPSLAQAVPTNPSPPPPPPVSQPTWVPNGTPATEQTPKTGTARSDSEPKVPSFWTTCPYCFVLFEYPSMYEESVLQCQTKSCRRAFQAVKVPSPPPNTEEDSYYCCWGFFPLAFKEGTKIPVSDLPKAAPTKKPAPKVYYYDEDDDDDSYIDSDPSEDDDDDDDDWRGSGSKKRKTVKQSKQKASSTKPKLGRRRKVIEVD